jgi:hypothetical protein
LPFVGDIAAFSFSGFVPIFIIKASSVYITTHY